MRLFSLCKRIVRLSGLTLISHESTKRCFHHEVHERLAELHTSRQDKVCNDERRLVGIKRTINFVDRFLHLGRRARPPVDEKKLAVGPCAT